MGHLLGRGGQLFCLAVGGKEGGAALHLPFSCSNTNSHPRISEQLMVNLYIQTLAEPRGWAAAVSEQAAQQEWDQCWQSSRVKVFSRGRQNSPALAKGPPQPPALSPASPHSATSNQDEGEILGSCG